MLCLPGLSAATPPRILVHGDSDRWSRMPAASGLPTIRYPMSRVVLVAPPALGGMRRSPIGARFDAQSLRKRTTP
ncbi:hypothetical protein EBB59_03910 [Lysobacter pythonis]|uniref:Uncharacterized protein n=1 Tax=Solilutibacter pythonis TaxID=2483112 RepID=A0A3M2I1G4_9GAMM|nr:hypothetical protein EBB59_03910 [Lysobacter pythonis]